MGDKSPPPPKAIYAFFGELVVNETFINVSKRFYPFINVYDTATIMKCRKFDLGRGRRSLSLIEG
jgi:hypothetical protein